MVATNVTTYIRARENRKKRKKKGNKKEKNKLQGNNNRKSTVIKIKGESPKIILYESY